MHRLQQEGNSFFITHTRDFVVNSVLSVSDIEECFQFAYDMSFGQVGAHRRNRTGGQVRRRNGEIFINTFQGKLAEFAFYNCCIQYGLEASEPDLRRMPLGEWDISDFFIGDLKIAIKSTKYFGNLLLLETQDWDDNGLYIPNLDEENEDDNYDYFVLIRIKPDGTGIMRQNRLIYSDIVDEHQLCEIILNNDWACNIAGVINYGELLHIIRNRFIIPQNAMLNGRMSMDAENYYVQAGDMHEISELMNYLVDN